MVKLGDFGLAKESGAEKLKQEEEDEKENRELFKRMQEQKSQVVVDEEGSPRGSGPDPQVSAEDKKRKAEDKNDGDDLTHTGGLGTMFYAAPEQKLSHGKYTAMVDIYSLGIVLFELYHKFQTYMERVEVLTNLQKGIVPSDFANQYPEIVRAFHIHFFISFHFTIY